MKPGTETLTAAALWERLAQMDPDTQEAWLTEREILLNGQWQAYVLAAVERHPGTPLLLYTRGGFPGGERQVPMITELQVRSSRK